MIAQLKKGTPISASVTGAGSDASALRKSTNEHLAEYEHRRHQMRLSFILPALDEGMSIGDIGRTLGVSRQLAARLVKEARTQVQAVEIRRA
jgi:hypothetical protein